MKPGSKSACHLVARILLFIATMNVYTATGANTLYVTTNLALVVNGSSQVVGLTNLLTGVNWITNASNMYSISGGSGLTRTVTYTAQTNNEILVTLTFTNPTVSAISVTPSFPYVLGLQPQTGYGTLSYCFPQLGYLSDTNVGFLGKYYGGGFPMQFIDIYAGAAGGIYFMSHDLSGSFREYELNDLNGTNANVDVYYFSQSVQPHTTWVLSFVIGAHTGDWHAAFNAYKNWVATWYSPLFPRKTWFQDLYNLREMFLYTNSAIGTTGNYEAYNPSTQTYSFNWLLSLDQTNFGGDDYVHLFDWSQTPTNGRCGDYNPWAYLGGVAAFSNQVAQMNTTNVPVGLYFEGYLISTNSKVGETYGTAWQLLNSSGVPYTSEGADSYYPCPDVSAWTNYITGRCMSAISNCAASGVYIDEFGFGWQYLCYDSVHGHVVPSQQVQAEGAFMKQMRQSLPASTVLYSEERGVDVDEQYQDGSFTYCISQASAANVSRLDLARFAFPDFKVFEILDVDNPVGNQPQLYMSVFFNGEGFWLEGPANNTTWFPASICTLITKEHALLREYADCFHSTNPVPLVPTLNANIYANMFPAAKRTVWTLYNAGNQIVSGQVLTVPYNTNSIYYDAWNSQMLAPSVNGTNATLTLSIPSGSAGCVVQEGIPALSLSKGSSNVSVNWSGVTLLEATNLLNANWTVLTNAASPLNLGPPTNSALFFRVTD
jgi:hypothetical protein